MSNLIKEKAREYLKAELSVIPTKEDKIPAINWKPYQSERMKEDEVGALFNGVNVKGLAIICGAVSNNLEIIDVDCKYDLTGSLWGELKDAIKKSLPGLLERLVIAQTTKKGYHLYYKCKTIQRNQKYAMRETTPEERQATYDKEIKAGATPEEAKKRSEGDTSRVLIETRGEGGYVIAPPTDKYTYISGEPNNIPTITPEEREVLFNISKSFNQLKDIEYKKPTTKKTTSTTYSSTTHRSINNYIKNIVTAVEDYNNRGDVLSLLSRNGWRILNTEGERTYVLRPGEANSKTSGNFHSGLRVLKVFSTSTGLDSDRGYSPAQAFCHFECDNREDILEDRLREEGYGFYPEGATIKATQVKTEKIKVEVVNTVNRESSVISTPGESLKIENIQTAVGDEVVITSPGSEAQEEILKTITLLQDAGKRVYIKEGDIELREYRYQLYAIFNKYNTIQETSGELTDRDRDSLLDEIIIVSAKLQPIDKDIFLKEFIELEATKELGITEESLSITVDRLTSTRDKEAKDEEFKKLLSKATELQDKGETDKALELLDNRVKEVKLKDKATEFNKLLLPTSEAEVKKEEESRPADLDTGYKIAGEEFLLNGSSVTVFAGATGHGKTIISINTALNVAERYEDKKFIFFTYEERDTAILQYFLNTYIDTELNGSRFEKSNRRLIKAYFKKGSTEHWAGDKIKLFEQRKKEFFSKYIETGRLLIKYVDYTAEELDLAIRYLHKNDPKIGGIFIDYFQLLSLSGKRKKEERINSRQEELKAICILLKNVAKDTGLPLILGAQFNREVTDLMKLHPTNIGEAGDIERVVSTLVGLWDISRNKPIEKKNSNGKESGDEGEIKRRIGAYKTGMYVELLKARDIKPGSYEILDYNGKTGKIKNRIVGDSI